MLTKIMEVYLIIIVFSVVISLAVLLLTLRKVKRDEQKSKIK